MFPKHVGWFSLAAAVGCGGHTLDVGSTDGGSGAGDLGGDAGAGGPAGPVWNGTLENAQLSDGSNRLTMTLAVAADGDATGTLLLGDGARLQPPTDPDVGYPPGAEFSELPGGGLGFFEGFPYTMLDGHRTGSRLTFRVAEVELWTRWCSLQTSYVVMTIPKEANMDGGPWYACTPTFGFGSGPTGCLRTDPSSTPELQTADIPIDCGKAGLCNSYACDCSATGCSAQSTSIGNDLSFDLTITGTNADGTISGELGDHGVHFVREQ
jgi:hypothetical protein